MPNHEVGAIAVGVNGFGNYSRIVLEKEMKLTLLEYGKNISLLPQPNVSAAGFHTAAMANVEDGEQPCTRSSHSGSSGSKSGRQPNVLSQKVECGGHVELGHGVQ